MAPCLARAQRPDWGVGLVAANRAPSLMWEASYPRVQGIGSVRQFNSSARFFASRGRPFFSNSHDFALLRD